MANNPRFRGCAEGEDLYRNFCALAEHNAQICANRGISPAQWDEATCEAWQNWSTHRDGCSECSGLKSGKRVEE